MNKTLEKLTLHWYTILPAWDDFRCCIIWGSAASSQKFASDIMLDNPKNKSSMFASIARYV